MRQSVLTLCILTCLVLGLVAVQVSAESCTKDTECPSGQVCNAGTCIEPTFSPLAICNYAEDDGQTCPNGHYCMPYHNVCWRLVSQCGIDTTCRYYFGAESTCTDSECSVQQCDSTSNVNTCGTGYECLPHLDLCHQQTCQKDTHCPTGYRCVGFHCEKAEESCSTNQDCYSEMTKTAWFCVNRECFPLECDRDEDCYEEYGDQAICHVGMMMYPTYQCIADPCNEANGDDDCPNGYECYHGLCLMKPECAKHADCTNGYGKNARCVNEVCVPAECQVDDDCEPAHGANATCNTTTGTCRPAECTRDEQCTPQHGPNGTCGDDGKCVAETCDSSKSPDTCPEGWRCQNDVCVEGEIDPSLSVVLHLILAFFSRVRVDAGDVRYNFLEEIFLNALYASLNCQPLDERPIAYGAKGQGYYVADTCKNKDAEDILDKLSEQQQKYVQQLSLLDADDGDADKYPPLTVSVKVEENYATVPATCVNTSTFQCGTEECAIGCYAGAECTKENAKVKCGKHQRCVFTDDDGETTTTGRCSSASLFGMSSLITFAVIALSILF